MEDKSKLDLLMNALGSSYKEFLGYYSLQGRGIELAYWQMVGFTDYVGFPEFKKAFKFWYGKSKKKDKISSNHFLYKYLILSLYYRECVTHTKKPDKNILAEATQSLTTYQEIERIKILCIEEDSYRKKGGKGKELDESVQEVTLPVDQEWSLLFLYQKLLQSMQSLDYRHFASLEKVLKLHWEKIARDELKQFLKFALNHCIREVNRSREAYLPALSLFFKWFPQEKEGAKNDQFLEEIFQNFIIFLFREARIEEADAFFNSNKDRFEAFPLWRTKAYCEGMISFGKKDWTEARKNFKIVFKEDKRLRVSLNAGVLLTRLFYINKDEWEGLEDCLAVVRKKARTTKAKEAKTVRVFVLYVDALRTLLKIQSPDVNDKTRELKILREKVENSEFPARSWLLKQIIHTQTKLA